ncbi:MAG: hypothetical protein QXX99_02930 [Candidatus Bathyarchaeia archaeon]
MEGRRTIGVYQLSVDSRVKWLCFDSDPEKLSKPEETARRILGVCLEAVKGKDGTERPRVWSHSLLLETSRYPDPSYHVWILFLTPVPARVARWLGFRLLGLAGLSPQHVEVFPKQDAVSDILPYGNLVKLPLGLHQVERKWSRFLDFRTFEPLLSDVLLEKIGLSFMEADIERIASMKDVCVQVRFEGGSQPASLAEEPLTQSEREFCVSFLYKLWVPGYRNQVEMAFLGWCIKNGVPYEDARWIIEEIVRRRNDEETSERLRLVDYHNRVHLGRRLKGLSGLKEAVLEALMR